jgi:hypothetical protein
VTGGRRRRILPLALGFDGTLVGDGLRIRPRPANPPDGAVTPFPRMHPDASRVVG